MKEYLVQMEILVKMEGNEVCSFAEKIKETIFDLGCRDGVSKTPERVLLIGIAQMITNVKEIGGAS